MIRHARDLIKKRMESKWEICKIAIKVCHIAEKKGGRFPTDAYSITNFAEDIGMNRKTLSCWLLDYEIYKKLDLEKDAEENTNYSEWKKMNGAINRTRIKLFNLNHMSRTGMRKTSKAKVVKTFEGILNKDVLIKRLEDFKKNLKHHKFTLENEEFDRSHLDALREYEDTLKQVVQTFNTVIGKL